MVGRASETAALDARSQGRLPTGGRRRIVLLTAGVGAGHDGPAREIARRVTALGHDADVVDLIELAPLRLGKLFCALFHAQLRWAPHSWGRMFRAMELSTGLPWLARRLVAVVTRRVAFTLNETRGQPAADVVVGTFPAAGHVVDRARTLGVSAPAVIYITDPAVHRLWIADTVDLYLTTWHSSAEDVSRHTDTTVLTVAPAVRPEFSDPGPAPDGRGKKRQAMGLPPGRLALLSSGSWGVGDVHRTALDVLKCTDFTPVVVCGRNSDLRDALAAVPGVVALGWVQDMAELMRSCDVAVLNSGGLTLAETAVCGLPVVHYRPLDGQGIANARFCEATGYASWPRTASELAAAMRRAVAAPPPSLPDADPLSPIIALANGSAAAAVHSAGAPVAVMRVNTQLPGHTFLRTPAGPVSSVTSR